MGKSLVDVTGYYLGHHSAFPECNEPEDFPQGQSLILKIGSVEYLFKAHPDEGVFCGLWERDGESFTEVDTSGMLPLLSTPDPNYNNFTLADRRYNTPDTSDWRFTPDGELLIIGGSVLPDVEPASSFYGYKMLVFKKDPSSLVYNVLLPAQQPAQPYPAYWHDYTTPVSSYGNAGSRTKIAISSDGQYMVAGFMLRWLREDYMVAEWYPQWRFYKRNGDTFDLLRTVSWTTAEKHFVSTIVFSPDTKFVAVGIGSGLYGYEGAPGAPFFFYERDVDSFNDVDLTSQFGSDEGPMCHSLTWANDFLIVGRGEAVGDVKPCFEVFKFEAEPNPVFTSIFTLKRSENELPAAGNHYNSYSAINAAISPCTEYFVFCHPDREAKQGALMEQYQLYKRDGEIFTKQDVDHIQRSDNGYYGGGDQQFSPFYLDFIEDGKFLWAGLIKLFSTSAEPSEIPYSYALFKTDLVPPPNFSAVAEEITHNSAKVQWDEVAGVEGYEIRYLELVPEEE